MQYIDFLCYSFIKGQPKFQPPRQHWPAHSLHAYSGRLGASSTSVEKAIWTCSRHSMHFLIAARDRVNICLNPLGFHTLVFPWTWPARNKGCVRPHSYCFIQAFASGERRKASTSTGSWRGTNAALLGVFQATLFCPVRAEHPWISPQNFEKVWNCCNGIGWHCPIKVTYWHFYPWKDNFKVGLMPEDDLLIKNGQILEDDWLKNCQIPEDDLPRLAKSMLTTSLNLKRRFDKTSSLKPVGWFSLW